jgi:pentatricopeptide repeat protein
MIKYYIEVEDNFEKAIEFYIIIEEFYLYPDLDTFTPFLNYFILKKKFIDFEAIYFKMISFNIIPYKKSFELMLNYYLEHNKFKKFHSILSDMKKFKIKTNNNLIDSFKKKKLNYDPSKIPI